MRYLSTALYAEGPIDYAFLCPLLQRVCEDLCVRNANVPVEISDVLPLSDAGGRNGVRAERVTRAASAARESWRLFFIHADADSDELLARVNRVEPAQRSVQDTWGADAVAVGIVPVRTTEAWALVDGNALRDAFGTTLSNDALGLPAKLAQLEQADGKRLLEKAFGMSRPIHARRRPRNVSPYLGAIAQRVDLSQLSQLAAFRFFELDLIAALQVLQILPEG